MGGVIHPYIVAARNLKIETLGGKVVIPPNSPVGLMKIGFHTSGIVDKKLERSMWQNSGEIVFDGPASFGSGVRISNSGTLMFGSNVCVTANTEIVCHKKIKIGSDCLFSWDILIMDTDFHNIYSRDRTLSEPINISEGIEIGKHTWMGCRCLVLKNTKIPANTVVAAGSTIAKSSFEKEYTVITSDRVLKDNVEWRK